MSNTITSSGSYKNKRILALTKLGNICVRCGFSDWRALQIDHKEGGSLADFETIGCSSSSYIFLKYLLNLSEEELNKKYQLLCANCNWIKRYEKNEWRSDGVKDSKEVINLKQNASNALRKLGISLNDVLSNLESI